ncbi:NusG domain II-containing protein [Acetivibrio clariflavus]|uniref:NusG domain II-containing protein n=2 Tax=Acetivibrio clariflavus TaxID=288965 RepID=UPI0004B673DA|nr:NusG domain II-containing protein [Acetivibrio clariflavus]
MGMNMLKKGDIVLIGIIGVAIVISSAFVLQYKRGDSGTHKIAVIKVKDKVVKSIDLSSVTEPQRIEISGKYNQVVLVEKGRIRFVEAECPDKVCVNTGWLYDKGDMAVCIPNNTMIKIEGQSSKVDIVTH